MQPDYECSDKRGSLTQLIRGGYSQINVISSIAGAERGGHYHKENVEAFYVATGRFSLSVCKDGLKESYLFHAGDMFCIPPYVSHKFHFEEDTLLVSMYSQGVVRDDGTKDIYPEFLAGNVQEAI
jgi:quercetin dioxygenase-like cupin family protein